MTNVLDKTIASDWYDMRQMLDGRHRFAEYMKLTDAELASLVQGLRLSVERGTVELKRKTLSDVFAFVDSLQFDTRSFHDFNQHIREIVKATYLMLMQRAYCLGNLASKPGEVEPGAADDVVRQTPIKKIVEDVQRRIAKDPSLTSNPAIKHILMQVSIYRREVANMKELAPNIPKEKAAGIRANFKKTFEEITRKIQDHYAALIQGDETPVRRQPAGKGLLSLDLRLVAPYFAAQAEDFTRIRSILTHAQREGYKTHEILSHILQKKDSSLDLVEREIKEYERLSFGRGVEIARWFAGEIANYIARRISVPAPKE